MFNYRSSKINHDDAIALGRAISLSIKKSSIDVYLGRQSEKIDSHIADIETLQGRVQGNPFTEIQSGLDDSRDGVIQAMNYEVESKLKMAQFAPEKAVSATALQAAFDRTPISIDAGYSQESNQIKSRIRLISEPKYQEHLTVIGLKEYFDYLISLQDQFDTASVEKDALESVKLRGTVKEQVKRIKSRISFSLNYLESQMMDIPETYEPIANEIAEVVSRIMAGSQARQTRKTNEN